MFASRSLAYHVRLARRRTCGWCEAAVHFDIASLASEITLRLAAWLMLTVTTRRLVVVGRRSVVASSTVAALAVASLLAVLWLLGIVVGIVLLLALERSDVACPSGTVEWLAASLATTTRANATALDVKEEHWHWGIVTYAMMKKRMSAAMTITARATQRPQLFHCVRQRYCRP